MAKPIRTTGTTEEENDDGYLVSRREDERLVMYHVEPTGEPHEVEVEKTDAFGNELPARIPPEVVNDIVDLGFTEIRTDEVDMRTSDPEEPAVGDEWYRYDIGVRRHQTPNGVVETRDFYRTGGYEIPDLPDLDDGDDEDGDNGTEIVEETVFAEDFDGVDIHESDDYNVIAQDGDPENMVWVDGDEAAVGDESLFFDVDGVTVVRPVETLDSTEEEVHRTEKLLSMEGASHSLNFMEEEGPPSRRVAIRVGNENTEVRDFHNPDDPSEYDETVLDFGFDDFGDDEQTWYDSEVIVDGDTVEVELTDGEQVFDGSAEITDSITAEVVAFQTVGEPDTADGIRFDDVEVKTVTEEETDGGEDDDGDTSLPSLPSDYVGEGERLSPYLTADDIADPSLGRLTTRGPPDEGELSEGEGVVYISDGSSEVADAGEVVFVTETGDGLEAATLAEAGDTQSVEYGG